ncbi:WxL domain-containing protein [Apilactobacillus timberlakei]|uniref:WxL domain-containing protein n=1 Tax=Apilactobacillus timberlakei TaxID=2008380 RepID=UPI0011292205|nr:WxL domain-containing protein [Apilactobacillus timberlakei]TPR22200.1 WxL domain-containing protein [Apilactobacillus timberlakei]
MKKLLLCTAALTMFSGSALALNGSNVKADNGSSTTTQTNTSSDGPKANTSKSNMDNNGNKIQTNTYFEVDNSNSSTPAADPNNPGSILENPTQHNVLNTDGKGDLTIDAVPYELNFGKTDENLQSNMINESLNFETEGDNAKYYYAQVSDHRSSTNGWFLTANMSDMNTNSGNKLNAAKIILNNNNIQKAYADNNNISGVNTTNPITLESDYGNVGIMSANSTAGNGTWLDRFNSILLQANKSSSGKYNGTITWNLTAGPGTPGSTNNTIKSDNQQTPGQS